LVAPESSPSRAAERLSEFIRRANHAATFLQRDMHAPHPSATGDITQAGVLSWHGLRLAIQNHAHAVLHPCALPRHVDTARAAESQGPLLFPPVTPLLPLTFRYTFPCCPSLLLPDLLLFRTPLLPSSSPISHILVSSTPSVPRFVASLSLLSSASPHAFYSSFVNFVAIIEVFRGRTPRRDAAKKARARDQPGGATQVTRKRRCARAAPPPRGYAPISRAAPRPARGAMDVEESREPAPLPVPKDKMVADKRCDRRSSARRDAVVDWKRRARADGAGGPGWLLTTTNPSGGTLYCDDSRRARIDMAPQVWRAELARSRTRLARKLDSN